jgi:hypothetical protein
VMRFSFVGISERRFIRSAFLSAGRRLFIA